MTTTDLEPLSEDEAFDRRSKQRTTINRDAAVWHGTIPSAGDNIKKRAEQEGHTSDRQRQNQGTHAEFPKRTG